MDRRNKGKYILFLYVHIGEYEDGKYFNMMAEIICDVVLIMITMITSESDFTYDNYAISILTDFNRHLFFILQVVTIYGSGVIMKFKSAESLYQVSRTHNNAYSSSTFPILFLLLSPLPFSSPSFLPLTLLPHTLPLNLPPLPPSLLPPHSPSLPHPSSSLSLTGPVALRCRLPRALCHPRCRRTQLTSTARTSHRPPYSHVFCILK